MDPTSAGKDNAMAHRSDPRMSLMDLEGARARIRERSDLNAFISVSSESGAGVVVAVKDLVDVKDMVTTAGGIILPDVPAAADAPVIRRIREEGCVVVGKANLHEDWFSHSDSLTGMGKSSDFMDAAFSAKEKSPPSEVATDSGYVVFEITAVQPPAAPTYDDVRSQVAGDYKNEQTAMGLYKKTQELGDRAHVLKDLQRAAKELGAKVETTSDFVGPQDPVKGLGSMAGQAAVAFSLKPGEISSPIRAGSNGAGLTVIDRKEPTQAEIDKGSDQVRESLVNEKRQEMLVLYIDGLRQTMQKEGKVKVNQKELDLYTKRAAPQQTSQGPRDY